MKIVELKAYAMGDYSGQTYNESIYISEELYQQIEGECEDLKLYISDLDGKHSEVECDIFIDTLLEDRTVFLEDSDGDYLYYKIEGMCDMKGLNLKEDIDKTITYLEKNDLFLKEVTVQIKPSQYPKLLEYVEKINRKGGK